MAIKVYVSSDNKTIDIRGDNDLICFKTFLIEGDSLYLGRLKFFNFKAKSLAFCAV